MKQNAYSVGQVNRYIKNMFAQDFLLHNICVKGEVSNCKYHSSGHVYFTLKDSAGAISAVMFAGNRRTGLTFRMKEGDKVIVTGSIEVYEKAGNYQLYARSIQPDGEGNLYLRFEALKKELEEMGMFAAEYKQPIPKFARTVGVVTAPTGAAVRDIQNISHRRNPFVQVILYPAQVQGEGAAESIVNGIRALERLKVDVIIVGRGGGSIEDLWAFNEEIVARTIFDCQIPIISAVGHETDWTIADYVADLRAPTPSAAAELAVFDYMETLQKLQNRKQRMDMILGGRVNYARMRVKQLQAELRFHSPASRLTENRRRSADYEEKLEQLMEQKLLTRRHRLELLAGALDANSPARKLSGGYAYVENGQGKPLTSVKGVEAGSRIRVYLKDGSFSAEVKEQG